MILRIISDNKYLQVDLVVQQIQYLPVDRMVLVVLLDQRILLDPANLSLQQLQWLLDHLEVPEVQLVRVIPVDQCYPYHLGVQVVHAGRSDLHILLFQYLQLPRDLPALHSVQAVQRIPFLQWNQ